jgi:diguanylate cyclase (GGDEF)-like protein/PAS domain S-box-containing protein
MNIHEILNKNILHLGFSESLKSLRREQHLRTLLDNFPFMVWLKDKDSRFLVANSACAKLVGTSSPEELEGKTDFDFFPEALAKKYVAGDLEAMKSDHPIGILEPIHDANGKLYWIETYKSALIVNNEVIGSLGYARDVTDALKNEREFRSIIQNSPNSIIRFDKTNKRIFINPGAADIYQVSPDFLLGKRPSEYPGGKSSKEFEKSIQDVFLHGKSKTVDLYWQSSNGSQRVIRCTLAAEFDPEGQIIAVISMGQDVSEHVKNQEHIQRLAYFDSLTNLPNRSLFSDRLQRARLEAKRYGHLFGLIIIDIDRFKEINDTLGHVAGDELLRESANRLVGCIRANDTVARLGGDEFAILLTKVRDIECIATVIDKINQSHANPFLISGKELFITLSIGIAIYPTDSNQVEELFKFADSALYSAKSLGRNNAQFYTKELTLLATDRMSLENALRKAIEKNEFELYYQPQVNIETKEMIGVEALIRWNRDHQGMVPPDKFIGIAEDSGLIVEIGNWVIYTACIAAVKWNAGRAVPFQVAINLSSRQFVRNDIAGSISRILKETNCKPEWIKLEITESLLLGKEENIKQIMGNLHEMGLQISLDDFGTGYSALGYLIHFPVDQLKVDRSFVNDITTNHDRGLLVKAIISMAISLRLNIIAEGVETIEQANYLRESGCMFAQGYFYGKPMRFEEISI